MDLNFGVEIEFSGLTRVQATEVLVEYFGTTSVRYGIGWGNDEYAIPDQQGRIWQIVKDNSVDAQKLEGKCIVPATEDYKCELVTPILQYTDIPMLLGVIETLKREGGLCNNNTGVHVHVDASSFTPKSLRTLCNLVYRHQYLLTTALRVKESRKRKYCADLSEEFIKELNQAKPTTFEAWREIWYSDTPEVTRSIRRNETRYRVLNLHNLLSGRFKAVEYRIFNGSLDTRLIRSYILLCLLITSAALRQKKAIARIAMSDNDRFSFRVSLLKLGAIGEEFREMRLVLLKNLEGDSGRRHPKLGEKPVPSKIKQSVTI